LGVGDDAAGVVVYVGGDDARADNGEKEEHAVAPLIAAREEAEDHAAKAVDEGVNGGEGHGRVGSGERRVENEMKRKRRSRRVKKWKRASARGEALDRTT
jgi:hypothetical protein